MTSTHTFDFEIARQDGDEEPLEADARFPRVGRPATNETSTVSFGDVVFGDERFVVIAGPCAVESPELIDRAANAVSRLGARVLRGGAFKPRTSPDTFQGHGLEGVSMLVEASRRRQIPFVTEVMSPEMVEPMAEHVDAFQIGARNMQNFALLSEVGRTDKPVLLKRNFGSTVTEWLMSAEHLAKAGNDRIVLCERGIRSFGEETRFTLDLAGAMWAKKESRLPVIIDPSHAIGVPELLAGAACAGAAAGLDGVMVEVHPDPTRALCDASQALTPSDFEDLMQRLRPVAEATGRPLA
ncbi:MAG: 3-deoxy-7-phosphoheptulonate synthase [Persicimonas sp.]